MVAKIMAIQRVDIANKNHRGATEGAKKKYQKKFPLKKSSPGRWLTRMCLRLTKYRACGLFFNLSSAGSCFYS